MVRTKGSDVIADLMADDLLVDLGDPGATREVVGSKAATLSSLVREGFRVPRAVVLTVRAFERFSDTTGPHPDLTEALVEAGGRLGSVPLAVRSSGLAEDLEGASFAGQYETVLGVQGLPDLEQAVRRCWQSARSEHVRAYMKAQDVDELPMGVIVQEQVPAAAAGVAFSANPVTGARDEVVINAVIGLGDRLVSGETDAEEWVVRGGHPECLSSPEPAIDPAWATRIARLTRQVEAVFGVPQDIEWAVAGDELSLLQARPITSLPSPAVDPVPIDVIIPDGRWERDVSHMPTPWHPIDRLTYPLVERAMRIWVDEFGYLFDGIEFRDIGGWVYNRMTPLGGKEGPELPDWVMWLAVRSIPMIRRRIRAAREAVRSDKAGRYIERWYEEWRPELDSTFARLRDVELAVLSDDALVDHIGDCVRLFGRGLEIHTLLHGSMAMILYEYVDACERLLGWDMPAALDAVGGTSSRSTEPSRQLSDLADIARRTPTLLDRSDGIVDDLVEDLGAIDEAFARGFAEYLDEHGHVSLGISGTLGDATLAETPALVLAMISGQVATGYRPDAADHANARTRAATLAAAREAIASDLDRAQFERLLERATRAYPVREDNDPYTMFRPLAATRYAILEVGRRLTERSGLETASDVLFLTLDEALDALADPSDHRALVDRRKGERLWAKHHPGPASYGEEQAPPSSLSFLPADARLPMEAILWSLDSIMAIGAAPAEDRSMVTGVGASAGRYLGPVRVVMDETEFDKLQPGDVLVCPITSPPWSIVFPMVGALVTDSGGVLSHPAIIAREYRVPAVVATGNATQRLRDGQVVTVDGTEGRVLVGDTSGSAPAP